MTAPMHTAEIDMHDVLNYEGCHMGTVVPVCPRWRTARCDQLDDSIQVWSSLAGPNQKNESGQTRISDLCFTRRVNVIMT